jgi:predicted RNA-binding Zn-ribbon protein involved in translation (DUF1610 family)
MMFDDEPHDESHDGAPNVGLEEQPTTQMPPKIPDIAHFGDTTSVEPEPEAPPPAVEPEPEAPPPAVEPEPEAPPPAVEPEPEAPPPAVEPEPDPKVMEEEPHQDSDSIELKSSCSSCSTSFKVRIPPGAPGVRVPCPACGSIEVVRRP